MMIAPEVAVKRRLYEQVVQVPVRSMLVVVQSRWRGFLRVADPFSRVMFGAIT